MAKQTFEIDGANSSTLEEFAEDFARRLHLQTNWRGNLDAFSDILYGGFGTPGDGFVLVWKNSALSRKRLGYPATIKWLDERIRRCHPSNIEHLRQRLALAHKNDGKTLFDALVEILQDHADIELILE